MSTPYVLAYRCSLQQEPICRGIETQFTFTCNVIDAVHYNNNAYKPIANIYVERETAELERFISVRFGCAVSKSEDYEKYLVI